MQLVYCTAITVLYSRTPRNNTVGYKIIPLIKKIDFCFLLFYILAKAIHLLLTTILYAESTVLIPIWHTRHPLLKKKRKFVLGLLEHFTLLQAQLCLNSSYLWLILSYLPSPPARDPDFAQLSKFD
jgi:hypothetical protein